MADRPNPHSRRGGYMSGSRRPEDLPAPPAGPAPGAARRLRRPEGCTCLWAHSPAGSTIYLQIPSCPVWPHSRRIDATPPENPDG